MYTAALAAFSSHTVSCSSLHLFTVFSHMISCGSFCPFAAFSPTAILGRIYLSQSLRTRPHVASFALPRPYPVFAYLQSSCIQPLLGGVHLSQSSYTPPLVTAFDLPESSHTRLLMAAFVLSQSFSPLRSRLLRLRLLFLPAHGL